jgi:hypothetical protein
MKYNLILILVLGLVLVAGCESDSVSPNDEVPALTEENAAYQAAMVAMALGELGPQMVNFSPAKNVYTYDFEGYEYVDGEVEMDFRLVGPEGAPATPSQADWVGLQTLGENGLTLTYEGFEGSAMFLTANLQATLDHDADTATVIAPSGGTLVAGEYPGTYDIDGVVVGSSGHPTAGTITFTGGEHTIEVEFNGTAIVPVSVNDVVTWELNLDNGELVDVTMPPM